MTFSFDNFYLGPVTVIASKTCKCAKKGSEYYFKKLSPYLAVPVTAAVMSF